MFIVFRKLEDGDIVNVDVTVYYKGVHGEKYISLELWTDGNYSTSGQ